MKNFKKFLVVLGVGIVAFLMIAINKPAYAAKVDGQNNVITSGAYIPSSMVSGRLFNQYTYKSGTGYVDVTVITYFDRATGTSPVKVKWITVLYNNQSNGTPYFSSFFIDKRGGGSVVYPTIPKEHKVMKKGSNSFTVTVNTTNVQSVQLYAHADLYGTDNNNRYQYITAFY